MEIIIIIAIVFLFYILQFILYRNNFYKGLTVDFKFRDEYIFEGDSTKIKETFINRKLLPLCWLRVQYDISSRLIFDDDKVDVFKEETNYKCDEICLLGYEKLEREHNVLGSRRGYYTISNMEIISSDMFVTSKYFISKDINQHLYVFPSLIDTKEFDIQFEKLLGDAVTRKQIISDPYEIKGIRDYTTIDNMKDINWSATARTGNLKVNTYDYTSSQEVLIFLSVQKENSWTPNEIIEESIRIADTLYAKFYEMGISVSFLSDAKDENGNFIEFSYFTGNSFISFNKMLSRIKTSEFNEDNIEKVIRNQISCENRQPLWIVITNSTRDSIKNLIIEAQNDDFDVQWIAVSRKNEEVDISNVDNAVVWEVKC